jgi:hypothetical protein
MRIMTLCSSAPAMMLSFLRVTNGTAVADPVCRIRDEGR